MATVTVYAGAGDGFVRKYGGAWSGIAATGSVTGNDAGPTSTADYLCMSEDTNPMAYRGFLPFNLSGQVPNGATITAVDVYIYVTASGTAGGGTSANNSVCLVEGTPASNTTLATTDYGNVGSTLWASRATFASFTTSAYNTISLNSTGIAACQAKADADGYFVVALRSGYDVDNTAPAGNSNIQTRYSEYASTTYDPYLVITYYGQKTYTADAIIKQEATKTYTADAIVSPDRWADTCTGSDSTNLESHTPTGPYGGAAASGTWSQWYPTSGFARLRINSNKLYSYTSSAIATDSEYHHSQQFTNGSFSADLSIPGAHNDGGYATLKMRKSGSTPGNQNAYAVYFGNGTYITAGNLSLEKLVSGSSTVLGTYSIGTLSNASTYTVALVVNGTSVSVKLNGTTVIGPVTDSSVTGAGYEAVEIYSPNGASTAVGVQVDNLLMEPVPAQPTQTYTADAIIAAAVASKTYTADAVIFGTAAKTYTADGYLADRLTKTYTADGVQSGTMTTAAATRTTAGSQVTVWSAGTVSTHGAHVTFPVGVKTEAGTILVVARKATSHATFDGDLVQKTSSDGGATWSSETTILNTAYDERPGNIRKLASGRLVMVWFSRQNYSPERYYAWFCYSDDNGATWSTPVFITNGYGADCSIAHDIVECANGNLVVALYGCPGGWDQTTSHIRTSYSTDGGATWLAQSTVAAVATFGYGLVEPRIIRRADDSLLCMWTVVDSPQTKYQATSTDNGATWSAASSVFATFNTVGLLQHPADGDIVVAYTTNPNAYFKTSTNAGSTYGTAVTAGAGSSGSYAGGTWASPFSLTNSVSTNPDLGVTWGMETGTQTQAEVYYRSFTPALTVTIYRTATYTADAVIFGTGASKTYTADAVITAPAYAQTYTADAIVFGTSTQTYTADTVVVDAASQSTSLSWFFRRRRSSMTQQSKTYTVVQAKGTARTATWTSPTYKSETEAGILVVLDVTSASGTGGLTLRINAHDLAGSVAVPLNSAPTAVTAAGTTSYSVYPFGAISGALTQSTSGYLPRQFSITVTHGDSSSYTYSIGYCLLP